MKVEVAVRQLQNFAARERIIQYIEKRPNEVFRNNEIKEALGVTYSTAKQVMTRLMQEGILDKVKVENYSIYGKPAAIKALKKEAGMVE